MIHLDTNFLINAIRGGTREDRRLRRWVEDDVLGLSSIAWTEFLCGPVSGREVRIAATLCGPPAEFGLPDAELAAELYNASGRRRGSLTDCMIAAAALNAGAAIATNNVADFERFASFGLVVERP